MPNLPVDPISRRSALQRLGVVAAAGVLPSRTGFIPERRNDAEEDVEGLLRLASVPSLTVATITGDRVETRGYGTRTPGDGTRVTGDTVYSAASLTKAVFAYALLTLVDDGRISLDAPVQTYLSLPDEDERGPRIKVRHLLSHSGGWRNWRFTASQRLTSDFEPGTKWSYSGEGFYFLQRIAENISGRTVTQLVHERVLAPLGMTRSSMEHDVALEPFIAPGHNSRGEPIGKQPDPPPAALPVFLSPNAAGSLLTTANDFGRFLSHLVTSPRKGGQPARIVANMMTPQIRCNEAIQWGLGVGLEDVGGVRYAWQWGDNPGYKNFYVADPRGERAVVVFTNGDHGNRVYERVVRAETGADHPAFLWL